MALSINKMLLKASGFELSVENLTLFPGEIVGLIGANGSGKSYFIKALTRELKAEEFNVRWKNRVNFQDDLSYVPDKLRMTVCNIKELELFYNEFFPTWNHEIFISKCKEHGFTKKTKLSKLSLGESQRLMISVASAVNGDLFILDEPSDGLDPSGFKQFIDDIVDFQDDDRLTIIATHQLKQYENILDRVIYLESGKVLLNLSMIDILDAGAETLESLAAGTDDIEKFNLNPTLDNFAMALGRRKRYV